MLSAKPIIGAFLWTLLPNLVSSMANNTVPPFANNTLPPSASTLIASGIKALGGSQALLGISGVTLGVPVLYRTQTLMEGYTLNGTETSIVTAGAQNVSFLYSSGNLQQRIDKLGQVAAWLDFGRESLDPLNYSLVVQAGSEGFACFAQGNNLIFDPASVTSGYTDGLLGQYLIDQAMQMSPKLLSTFDPAAATSSYVTIPNSKPLLSVFDPVLNLSIIFDPDTHLPYIIRSFEDHLVFGPSTSDLMVYNYTSIDGVMFPRRFKIVYNNVHLLADFLVESIDVNPSFPAGFFDGLPVTPNTPIPALEVSAEYGAAEIGEYSANALYNGKYTGTLANLSATHPVAALENLWRLNFADAPSYSQMVLVFCDAVIVTDATPHQSHLVIQWVREQLGRNITHIWVTHHHHDHSYGVHDYISAGAKMIVLDKAEEYWSNVPGIEFETYSDEKPYIHKDADLQVRFIDLEDPVHAEDQSYAFVSAACPKANDTVVTFQADYWNPNFTDYEFDQNQALVFYNKLARDGVARSSLAIPAHGSPTPFQELIDVVGFPYPNHDATSFHKGGPLC
ncbi:hypothetical protein D0Z07_1494 [Hyphodiscus hymeniophilus]|uniref:Metallo-beta-lactamase domain-containing protein n=1 Tax=Hyphodiscus hymeniophilus TaxID=353542 RepID=A0A9P7AZU4_9HELO|nr:hypothetical protein D0Z07_1494 [Hyphodiscus hymeniophilus]